ncbi:MAG: hypothetical protein IT487_10620 [Chromatiaceae bacterium]|nr:hypothetical protein [Chromatiaceae bacterium]
MTRKLVETQGLSPRRFATIAVLTTAMGLLCPVVVAGAGDGIALQAYGGVGLPEVAAAVAHDTSPALRDIPAVATALGGELPINHPIPNSRIQALKQSLHRARAIPASPDLETAAGATPMPAPLQNFPGMDNVNGYYPPDTNGDVGPNHYVQIVNVSLAVYSKTGDLLYGPVDNNTLWDGFGGACETQNDGDPIVLYDALADRWLISQFAVPDVGDNFECVAISTSGDPLGSYYRYAFSYGTDFPDYPKIGVWPDGYYVTYNMFGDAGFKGVTTCALERRAMLNGDPASRQQCFFRAQEWSLLPSDLDGHNPPPVGSPNYIIGEHWDDFTKLTMYRFAVDWDTTANSSFTGPVYITVDPYTPACLDVTDRGRCVPQPSPGVLLESLGGHAMYRLAYRNFGTHESLVVNHSVAMDGNLEFTSQIGVGWYEIRSPGAPAPVVYQEGTSASDVPGQFRWMGSIAMDRQGNMALGYSSSSTSLYPSIHYIGRLATDPLGTMPFAEGLIMAGTGSQTGTSARWGDYTAMQVDPVDDCTFWYTNEYLVGTSWNDWTTQIASFKFPGCGPTPAPVPAMSGPAMVGLMLLLFGVTAVRLWPRRV